MCMLEKGGIYEGTPKERQKQNTVHYIICLDDVPAGSSSFSACIISTDGPNEGRDNLPMLKEHFIAKDNTGNPYKIQFNNTHLVKKNFEKDTLWVKPNKVGFLSSSGVQFVQEQSSLFGTRIHTDKPIWKI